jgi:hypothetical protein
LELRVERQRGQPRLRRFAGCADGLARVCEEKPGPLLVVSEYFRDAVRPAAMEFGREARLECLYRRARLEPGDAAGDWHAQYRPPRPLVYELDRAGRLRVRADPLLDGEKIDHDPTMALRREPWPEFAPP